MLWYIHCICMYMCVFSSLKLMERLKCLHFYVPYICPYARVLHRHPYMWIKKHISRTHHPCTLIPRMFCVLPAHSHTHIHTCMHMHTCAKGELMLSLQSNPLFNSGERIWGMRVRLVSAMSQHLNNHQLPPSFMSRHRCPVYVYTEYVMTLLRAA